MALRIWAVLVGLVCLCAAGDVSAARKGKADTSPAIKANPNVQTGVLPNGLRYAVMRSESPKGGLSLRLTIDAGIYDEEDSERGAAHFVEHMAFDSARVPGQDDPVKVFEAAGVSFGRDQNAFTTPFDTSYRLDLPSAEGALADEAFKWMRSVADGTRFEEGEVARERGVMLAERGSRGSPTYEAGQALAGFILPPGRLRERVGLDPVEGLQRMTPATLRAFYERWYRPDRAVLVVVGDLPPEALKKRVEDTFSSWTGKGPSPVRAPFGPPPSPRPFTVSVKATPHTVSQVNVCRALPSTYGPMTSVDDIKRVLLTRTWVAVLQMQLAGAAGEKDSPFTMATANFVDFRAAAVVCVSAVPTGDDWKATLNKLQAVLADVGVTPTSDTLAQGLATLSAASGLADGAYADDGPTLSTAIASALLRGDVIVGSDEYARVVALASQDVTGEAVRQAFRRDWRGDGPLVSVFLPQPPDTAAVETAWQAEEARLAAPTQPAEPPVKTAAAPAAPLVRGAVKEGTWPYFDFGRPGRVVKRDHVEKGDFNRYTFANGVVLNIKSKGFDGDVVAVGVRFGGGRMELADGDVFAANMAAPLLGFGGLGRLDYEQMQGALSKAVWSAALNMSADHFTLSGVTVRGDVRTELQVLAAFMTDPGFRPYQEQKMRTGLDTIYRIIDSTPMAAIVVGQDRIVAANGPKTIPPREEAMAVDSKVFARVLRPILTGAPLEVSIAGNVDEGWAVRWVGETFGALPARSAAPRTPPGAWVRRFPRGAMPAVRVDTADAQGAVVAALWPLYPANTGQRREEIALRILTPILDDAVRQRIRWKLGKAYSDTAMIDLTDGPDQGYLAAAVSTSTEDADLVAAEMPRTVEALLRGEIDPADFERAKKAVKDQLAAESDLTSPSAWLVVLEESTREPGVFDDLSGMGALIDSVTLDDVKQAAARWLARPPLIIIAAPPKLPARACH